MVASLLKSQDYKGAIAILRAFKQMKFISPAAFDKQGMLVVWDLLRRLDTFDCCGSIIIIIIKTGVKLMMLLICTWSVQALRLLSQMSICTQLC